MSGTEPNLMEIPGSAFTKRPAPPELLGRSFCYGCAWRTWDNQSKMCAKLRTLPYFFFLDDIFARQNRFCSLWTGCRRINASALRPRYQFFTFTKLLYFPQLFNWKSADFATNLPQGVSPQNCHLINDFWKTSIGIIVPIEAFFYLIQPTLHT